MADIEGTEDTVEETAVDDTKWIADLEAALTDVCDFGTVKSISRGRSVPAHLRPKIWQICLNIADKGDQFSSFDELYDLSEQSLIREDCQQTVEKLGIEAEEKLLIASDLESILTLYCKSRGVTYDRDAGWTSILQPLLTLKFTKPELYNSFYAVVSKYIPRNCRKNGKPFHLFRLLLLYHDPELCRFLDTKRIFPDSYAQTWFLTLFAGPCQPSVVLAMWDVYLQHEDQFLVFFLALVIVVNARDQILAMETQSKQEIIEKLSSFPHELEAEDIEDFCSLAQYYESKTPQSFRQDFQSVLFGTTLAAQKAESDCELRISHALCLTVSVDELLHSIHQSTLLGDGLRYFLVDCRPAEQYNAGHLPTAFHLDANLMLMSPSEFTTAVDALLASQVQALNASAVAAGEHLCFVGSGREEEDQYVHMVVAHFLQRYSQYVSTVAGGFAAVHEALRGHLGDALRDHNAQHCIVCNPEALPGSPDHNGYDSHEDFRHSHQAQSLMNKFEKFSSVFKSTSAVVKEKMINYIKNEHMPPERHVSSSDKVGKRYRNMASIFTIGDGEEDGSSDGEEKEIVSVESWLTQAEIKQTFECQEVTDSGYMYQSRLCLGDSHLIVLRDIPRDKTSATIQVRRPLNTILKITSKKRHPEFITFTYGINITAGSGSSAAAVQPTVTAVDRLIIPQAGEATKCIKLQIMKVLEALEAT